MKLKQTAACLLAAAALAAVRADFDTRIQRLGLQA